MLHFYCCFNTDPTRYIMCIWFNVSKLFHRPRPRNIKNIRRCVEYLFFAIRTCVCSDHPILGWCRYILVVSWQREPYINRYVFPWQVAEDLIYGRKHDSQISSCGDISLFICVDSGLCLYRCSIDTGWAGGMGHTIPLLCTSFLCNCYSDFLLFGLLVNKKALSVRQRCMDGIFHFYYHFNADPATVSYTHLTLPTKRIV